MFLDSFHGYTQSKQHFMYGVKASISMVENIRNRNVTNVRKKCEKKYLSICATVGLCVCSVTCFRLISNL